MMEEKMKLSNAFLRSVNEAMSLNRPSLTRKYRMTEKYLKILENPKKQDADNLAKDWEAVGNYLWTAMGRRSK